MHPPSHATEYPTWPGRVHALREERDRIVPVVCFFGDNAKERISKPEGRLYRFRCNEMQQFALAGAAHAYGGEFFLASVEQVRGRPAAHAFAQHAFLFLPVSRFANYRCD